MSRAVYATPMSTPPSARPTVAMLVIGDEILTGKIQDENSPWVARRCREIGLELRRIIVLPDIVDEVGSAVAEWSRRVDFVLTSGGVGPTHDDLTMAAVAAGLGRPLVRDEALLAVIQEKMGKRFTKAAARMADIPQGSALWWDGDIFFPQVVAANVVIFPGVPSLFRLKFNAIAHRFGGRPVFHQKLVTTAGEADIADELTAIQLRWPSVAIGSYPQFDTPPWTVTLTLDGLDEGEVAECAEAVAALLGDTRIG